MKAGNILTRIHLWIGEHLGLTRYTSCWSCKHARVIDQSADVCCCAATPGELMIACCSEAVWCPSYEEWVIKAPVFYRKGNEDWKML